MDGLVLCGGGRYLTFTLSLNYHSALYFGLISFAQCLMSVNNFALCITFRTWGQPSGERQNHSKRSNCRKGVKMDNDRYKLTFILVAKWITAQKKTSKHTTPLHAPHVVWGAGSKDPSPTVISKHKWIGAAHQLSSF